MACVSGALSPNNSITIEEVLTNPLDPNLYVNNAVVSVNITDRNGDSITGFPASLPFVEDGIYRETFNDLDVIPNHVYTVTINGETPEPLKYECSVQIKATIRNCS